MFNHQMGTFSQELEILEDDAQVFKLIGPVLVKQVASRRAPSNPKAPLTLQQQHWRTRVAGARRGSHERREAH